VRFHLKGRVKVNSTEDLDKVKRAVDNIFSVSKLDVTYEGDVQTIVFEDEGRQSLSKLRDIIKQDRIRDAVRKALNERIEEGRIRFYLNKQVAYVKHVSLCEPVGESPLGPIEVEIECNEPRELVEWLTSIQS